MNQAFAQSPSAPSVPAPEASTYQAVPEATASQPHKGFDVLSVGMMVLMFGVFYFFMIRPQQKKMKQQREMISALKAGDHVVTTGGLLGVIRGFEGETHVKLEIAEGVAVKALRASVSEVTPRGSAASDPTPTPEKKSAKKPAKDKVVSTKS